jgi:hypothetical protein
MLKQIAFFLLVTLALFGSVHADSNDAASQFIGSWSLVSFTDVDENGKTIDRYGENAFGRITYGTNGKMMVVLMRRGREDINDSEFFSYTGSFDVDEVAGTVTHHVEACNAPSWVGTDRVRKFEMLGGDRIALRPVEGTSELIWEREE